MITLLEALDQASHIEGYLFCYEDLYISMDPGEESDWLMVRTESSDWECFPPNESIEKTLFALNS